MKKLLGLLSVVPFAITACGGSNAPTIEASTGTYELTKAAENARGLSSDEHKAAIATLRTNLPEYSETANTIDAKFKTSSKFKELPANIQRIVRVFDENQWEDVFNVRREAYQYRGFLEAAVKYPAFCGEKGSTKAFAEKSHDDVCKRELSSLFAHFTQEVGHDNILVKADGTGVFTGSDIATTIPAANLNGSHDGQGEINKKIKKSGTDGALPSGEDFWKTGLHYTEARDFTKASPSNWQGPWFYNNAGNNGVPATIDNPAHATDPSQPATIPNPAYLTGTANGLTEIGLANYKLYSTDWAGSTSWANTSYPNPRNVSVLNGKLVSDKDELKSYSYHGRGAKQVSFNFNYGELSYALFGDFRLLQTPDRLLDGSLSFASALHFHMRLTGHKPSIHEVVTGIWEPTATDLKKKRDQGFGVQMLMSDSSICGPNAAGWQASFTPEGKVEVDAHAQLIDTVADEKVAAYQKRLYWTKFTEFFGVEDKAWFGDVQYTNDCTAIGHGYDNGDFWYPTQNADGSWPSVPANDATVAGDTTHEDITNSLRNVFLMWNSTTSKCEATYIEEGPFSIVYGDTAATCEATGDGLSRKDITYGPANWTW